MPTRKVTVGVFSGACIAIVVWAVKQWGHVEIPAEVAVAMSTVITAVVQYIVPNAE